jgi:hypothetical protein
VKKELDVREEPVMEKVLMVEELAQIMVEITMVEKVAKIAQVMVEMTLVVLEVASVVVQHM